MYKWIMDNKLGLSIIAGCLGSAWYVGRTEETFEAPQRIVVGDRIIADREVLEDVIMDEYIDEGEGYDDAQIYARKAVKRMSAEGKGSCCCGATAEKPCACMIQGIKKCSATCPCSMAQENQCSVCGSEAVHHYKNGAVQLCDKHFQQQFGRYSAETFEASADDYGDVEYIILELLTDAQLEEEYGEVMDDYGIGRDDLPQKLEDEYRTSEEAEYLRGKYLQEEEAESFETESRVCSECQIYGYWDDNPVCPMCRMKKNAESECAAGKEYVQIFDTTITQKEIEMKLWKAGIKPIEVFVFNKDTFGVYLQPWAVDAFREEFNKKDWTGRFEFEAESFEAPHVGSDALMDIGKDTDLSSFTTSELTKSSAIHGDFDTASLDYSGHQNLEVRRADSVPSYQENDNYTNCPKCGYEPPFYEIGDELEDGSIIETEDEAYDEMMFWLYENHPDYCPEGWDGEEVALQSLLQEAEYTYGSTGDTLIHWEDYMGYSSPSMPPLDVHFGAEQSLKGKAKKDGTKSISDKKLYEIWLQAKEADRSEYRRFHPPQTQRRKSGRFTSGMNNPTPNQEVVFKKYGLERVESVINSIDPDEKARWFRYAKENHGVYVPKRDHRKFMKGSVKTMSGKPHKTRILKKDKDITPEEAATRLKLEACHSCGTPKRYDAEYQCGCN